VKPPKSILDAAFRYVPSAATDLAKTFERIRRQQRDQKKKDDAVKAEADAKVRKIGRDPK
jgi:hypothetical protein